MTPRPTKASFKGASGAELAARIDLPAGPVKAFALFAHCFTCSKDIAAARVISTAMTRSGIGVMRFDFTGLGGSGGDFGSTNFSMNLGDLKRAGEFLAEHYAPPSLLIGHSLGGAAVLAAAGSIPSVKAVVTVNAPSDVHHVTGNFAEKLPEIMDHGAADVRLAERPFRIEKQFLDDLDRHDVIASAAALRAALLVLHAPRDTTVGIENAGQIFGAAKHPKSFVSLDSADHLLTDRRDAAYAAEVIGAWASRYLELDIPSDPSAEDEADVFVTETAQGKFQTLVETGPHHLIADEPVSYGGLGSGPSPYDLLSAALGTCTVMTLRMYADRKGLPVDRVSCSVSHAKTHGDSMDPEAETRPDLFTRHLKIEGDLDEPTVKRLYEIADRCPVHRTLHAGARVETKGPDQ